MAVATAPGSRAARQSFVGKLLTAVLAHLRPLRRPLKVAELVSAARQHVVTVAALTAMDFGGFSVWHHGGWFVLTASLFLFDFAVRG